MTQRTKQMKDPTQHAFAFDQITCMPVTCDTCRIYDEYAGTTLSEVFTVIVSVLLYVNAEGKLERDLDRNAHIYDT